MQTLIEGIKSFALSWKNSKLRNNAVTITYQYFKYWEFFNESQPRISSIKSESKLSVSILLVLFSLTSSLESSIGFELTGINKNRPKSIVLTITFIVFI